MRCQPDGRDSPSPEERAPQLTRTDPSRTAHPLRPGAPAGPLPYERGGAPEPEWAAEPERSRTAAGQSPEPAAAASDLSNLVGWCVAVSHCHTVSHNVNTALLQRAPNLLNLLLIHTTNANTTVNLAVAVLHNFELKHDTVQPKNDFPAQ